MLYNPAVNMPEIYLSNNIPSLNLNLTPKEHPIENKIMYWLHECHLAEGLPNNWTLVSWLSTIIVYVIPEDD